MIYGHLYKSIKFAFNKFYFIIRYYPMLNKTSKKEFIMHNSNLKSDVKLMIRTQWRYRSSQ